MSEYTIEYELRQALNELESDINSYLSSLMLSDDEYRYITLSLAENLISEQIGWSKLRLSYSDIEE